MGREPRRDTLRDFASYVCGYAQEFFKRTSIQCLFDVDPEMSSAPLDLPLRRSLLMAIKETLNNAAKHSGATEVMLQIRWQRQKLVVVVEDNGKGFAPAAAKAERNGLINMSQRMKELGGACLVTSQPGQGCRVVFSIPLSRWHWRPWNWIWKAKQLSAPINETKNPQANDAPQIHDPSTAKPPSRRPSRAISSSNQPPLKVALVEDQPEVRESWTRLLNSFSDFACVCACTSGEEALRIIPQEQPDVILMDIFLPRMSGIECTARLKVLLPQIQIIILTAMDDQELVFLALEAGADGYLLKRTKPSDLRAALLDVLGGGAPMTGQIARRVIESFRRKAKTRDESLRLSVRRSRYFAALAGLFDGDRRQT